ncbi:MAG: glycosyltransferase family 9 protein [Candidatus Sumerlaeia bacterium]|nr:glycosyltransferase family 9 protein [Candidatus Sumerlaeia bacterium]
MTTFAEINPDQIRTDCRFYTGYKPCHKHDGCPDCSKFESRGSQSLLVAGGETPLPWLREEAATQRGEGAGWIVAIVPQQAIPPRPQWADIGIDEFQPLDSGGAMAILGRVFTSHRIQDSTLPDDLLVQHCIDRCRGVIPRPENPAIAGRVLIIKLGAMGDVLRTKVILPEIKRHHPEWKITWLTEPPSLPLLDDDRIDEALAWSSESLQHVLARGYERVYCLDKDAHAVSLSREVHARERYGFKPTAHNTAVTWNREANYALRLGLSDELKFHENTKSAPEVIAEACALPYDGKPYRLRVAPLVRGRVAPRLQAIRRGMDGDRRLIGLNTGCGPVFATKAWPLDRMKEFVRLVMKRRDRDLLLLGGPRERHIHQELMKVAGEQDASQPTIHDGGTDNTLQDFFVLVEGCDVVASADSLAMHVAVALGVPVVSWFGSTCHQEIDLYGNGEKLVTDFPCSPCYLKECPKEVFCLSELTARDVLDSIDRVLDPGLFS